MSSLETTITAAEALRASLSCPVHVPGDDAWDAARAAWNLTVDQQPVAVVVPQTTADVVLAVQVARDLGLRVAPQASGHNAGATASLDDTIVLRMTALKGVVINPVAKRARVAAGTEWKEVTGPASAHGLAPLAGSSPQVSVVGYSLGGGISWLGRKHGLAADAILAFEIVTADGQLRRVDPETDPDLFWAVRGGGGNFGVVTTVEIRLFEEPELTAGAMFFPLDRAAEIVRVWRDLTLRRARRADHVAAAAVGARRPVDPRADARRASSSSSTAPSPARPPRPTRRWRRCARWSRHGRLGPLRARRAQLRAHGSRGADADAEHRVHARRAARPGDRRAPRAAGPGLRLAVHDRRAASPRRGAGPPARRPGRARADRRRSTSASWAAPRCRRSWSRPAPPAATASSRR